MDNQFDVRKVVASVPKRASRTEFQGGPDDAWFFNVTDTDFNGGYYTPAVTSGSPDNWAPAEGEDPEVSCTIELWIDDGPTHGDSPDFIIVIDGKTPLPEGLPDGVEAFINDTIIPALIEDYWENPPEPDYDYPDIDRDFDY